MTVYKHKLANEQFMYFKCVQQKVSQAVQNKKGMIRTEVSKISKNE